MTRQKEKEGLSFINLLLWPRSDSFGGLSSHSAQAFPPFFYPLNSFFFYFKFSFFFLLLFLLLFLLFFAFCFYFYLYSLTLFTNLTRFVYSAALASLTPSSSLPLCTCTARGPEVSRGTPRLSGRPSFRPSARRPSRVSRGTSPAALRFQAPAV